jgi:hypothetical protein
MVAAVSALLAMAAGLGGCAQAPVPQDPPATVTDLPGVWTAFALPGKRSTSYRHAVYDGRRVIVARAESSASMYRQKVSIESTELGTLRFSWWVPALIDKADLSDRDAEDSPVRVLLAFDGDRNRLSAKNRMLFDLAESLTGEAPPYATLMYVWDTRSPLETVLSGGRSDRIRKIVVDSGPGQLRSWRLHQRDIVRDFERAFGEPPGRLIGIGLMTDGDNTASRTEAYYGELVLTGPSGATRQFNE